MDAPSLLKWLVKTRDSQAIILANVLLDFAEFQNLEFPDWVSALAALTDPKYLDVIDDLMKAEEELS